jgi:sialate O-acetylesterase
MFCRLSYRRLVGVIGSLLVGGGATSGWGAVALPSVFSDHMVLQCDKRVPVWGWAEPGEHVVVAIAGQTHEATADPQGKWQLKLDPIPVTHEPLTMVVEASNRIELQDVLAGEVWVCSGQSNMQWSVDVSWNADLAILGAKHPQIRLLTVENAGVQKPIEDFEGQWQVCSPETVPGFSAVGYYFGQQLHEILDVPIGLIDNAWGGSSCEAWVQRELFDQHPDLYGPLMQRWTDKENQTDAKEPYEAYEAGLLEWQQRAIAAKQKGEPVPSQPPRPNTDMITQHRPGNLFNGRVAPIVPFAIRGVIWYQGESNASRAYQYRHLFPLTIQNWRNAWQQGDFPFYWVQLADFRAEHEEPSESDWAELREAQTMAQDQLANTGEAVIIDIGEAADIHPRNKREVGNRLARLALAQDYGVDMAHRSPRYDSMEVSGGKATLSFKHLGDGLRTVDKQELQGFTIAGADQKWHRAQARFPANEAGEGGTRPDRTKVVVWSDAVTAPVAVRYAWADNPVCNLYSTEGLPLTPFRTDDWPGVTSENR